MAGQLRLSETQLSDLRSISELTVSSLQSILGRLNELTPTPMYAEEVRGVFLALESWCAKIRGIHKIGQMLFRSTALWGGGFAYLIDKKARRMHLP